MKHLDKKTVSKFGCYKYFNNCFLNFFLGTGMKLFQLIHCAFDFFYVIFKKAFRVKNLTQYLIPFFRCDGIIINIRTYNVIFWEKYITFAIIDFHVVQVKPLKKNFRKVLHFFYQQIFSFVNNTKCGIVRVTGYCDANPRNKKNKLQKKKLHITGSKIDS